MRRNVRGYEFSAMPPPDPERPQAPSGFSVAPGFRSTA